MIFTLITELRVQWGSQYELMIIAETPCFERYCLNYSAQLAQADFQFKDLCKDYVLAPKKKDNNRRGIDKLSIIIWSDSPDRILPLFT